MTSEGTVSFFLEQLFLLPVSVIYGFSPAASCFSFSLSCCTFFVPFRTISSLPKCEGCPQPPSFLIKYLLPRQLWLSPWFCGWWLSDWGQQPDSGLCVPSTGACLQGSSSMSNSECLKSHPVCSFPELVLFALSAFAKARNLGASLSLSTHG